MVTNAFIPDVFPPRCEHRPRIDLNGRWALRIDSTGIGVEEGWHQGRGRFRQSMEVPGVPQAQGLGRPTRELKTYFDDPFWIRRKFHVPGLPGGRRLWLRIGGILPAADIYINGCHAGYTRSSRTPLRTDITDLAHHGEENLVAVRVGEPPDVRLDGVYEMPGLTYNWTGPYGPISCEITGTPSVVDLYANPDLDSGGVGLYVRLSRPAVESCIIVISVRDGNTVIGTAVAGMVTGEDCTRTFVNLQGYHAWSPDDPVLYDLEVSLYRDSGERLDRAGIRFGMRRLEVRGDKFYLNGRPVLLRLYGDNHIHPDTLCPPAKKEWYTPRLKRARSYGMNGVKGCVETIPTAYIEAADEVGMMIIQEMPFGLSELRENRYTISREFTEYYSSELDGLVRTSRNHASIVAYSMSSEVELAKQTPESFEFFSRDLVRQTKGLAPHSLVVDCTGYVGPDGLETPLGRRLTDFYVSLFKGRKDVLDEAPPLADGSLPLILHEYHWWSCYPDPSDRKRYGRTQMRPFWLDSLERTARQNGQWDLIQTYRKNSLWLQALCRKDGIEYVRRTPNTEGYILWLLQDLGLWSEGLLDDFWRPKNVSARDFLRSNGDTVVVLGREGNRCFAQGETISIPVLVDHYGMEVIRRGRVEWRVTGAPIEDSGALGEFEIEPGEKHVAGVIEITPAEAEGAYKFDFEVELFEDRERLNDNSWSFWAFPELPDPVTTGGNRTLWTGPGRRAGIGHGTEVVVTNGIDEEIADFVEGGGGCILFTGGTRIENPVGAENPGDPYKMFRTIPWNAGDHGNSGTVVSDHPCLARYPHEGRCDLQFISMLKGYQPMDFGPLVKNGVEPIIRMVDHYASNRNLAHMLGFSVGDGRVIATSMGIMDSARDKIEARYLLGCLIEYLASDEDHMVRIPRDTFLRLFSKKQ